MITTTCIGPHQHLATDLPPVHCPTRDYGVAGMLFFDAMTLGEMDGDTVDAAANKVRTITQVDAATARKFLEYAKSASKTLNEEAPQRNREFCARRAEMNTLSRLAMGMADADARHEQRRAQLVRGAEAILGREGMLRLESYLSTRDLGKERVDVNYLGKLEERKQSPEQVLARICNPK